MTSFVESLRFRNRPGMKSLVSAISYLSIRILGFFVRALSLRQARRVACLLGDFMHKVVGMRREMVYRNIALSFPGKSPAEIRNIATGVYRNVAVTLIDVLRFPLIRSREDVAALIDLDPAIFLKGTDNGRKGAVLVSGHFGNWELMALAFGMMVKPLTIIVKGLSNESIDRSMNELRTLRGNSVVYDRQALREGMRLLEEGGVLAVLSDQSDPGAKNYIDFLGRRATVFQGAAFFALKAKVPLFVGMCRRSGDGKYTTDTHEIDTSDLSFNKADIATLTERYTAVIEDYIRRWPEEWFWLHNRWKNGGEWQSD
ncbi:MAG: lysophospholipid acyltransferase family protein [Chlorobiaceae bacterium]|nr:lysophospholipid acyltransferase family protein [Chlorobiaceae bacterium]